MRKETFAFQEIERYSDDGMVVEFTIRQGSAEWSEEYSEYEDFLSDEDISERYFKNGVELNADDWYEISEEYEETRWGDELIFISLDEAKKMEQRFIDDL